MSKNEIEAATAYKFLFISEFIVSYFYELFNRFGFFVSSDAIFEG